MLTDDYELFIINLYLLGVREDKTQENLCALVYALVLDPIWKYIVITSWIKIELENLIKERL